MDAEMSNYLDPIIEYAPKVLGVLLALFFAWVIASWTERGQATPRPSNLSTRLPLFPLWDPSSGSSRFLRS